MADLYSGSSQDWAREYGRVKYSYTVELRDEGDQKFLLPPEDILPTCEETWEAVKVVARYLHEIRNSDKISLLNSFNSSSSFRPRTTATPSRTTTSTDDDYDDESVSEEDEDDD